MGSLNRASMRKTIIPDLKEKMEKEKIVKWRQYAG